MILYCNVIQIERHSCIKLWHCSWGLKNSRNLKWSSDLLVESGKPQHKKKRKSSDNVTRGGGGVPPKPILVTPTAVLLLLEGAPSPLPP